MPNLIFGRCPQPENLGPRTDDDKSICAMVYKDAEDDAEFSCLGDSRSIFNKEETSDLGSSWDNEISSLVVREGCTLEVFWEKKYHGFDKKYRSEVYANLDHDHIGIGDWDDDISSYKCTCDFNPVDCEPGDAWEFLTSCTNTDLDEPIKCTYMQQHGTTVGDDVTHGGTFSLTIEAKLRDELNAIFDKVSIGGGGEFTGAYEWSKSHEFETNEITGVEVQYAVPAGETAGVYQILGNCGDSYIKTLAYEVRKIE